MHQKETKVRRETKKRDEYPLYSPDTVAAQQQLPEYGYGRTSNQETGQVIVPMVLKNRIDDFISLNQDIIKRKKVYRVYLRPGEQPPKGRSLLIGDRGEAYYETAERMPTEPRQWLTPEPEVPPVEPLPPPPKPPELPPAPKVDLDSLRQFVDGLDTDSPGRSVNKLENQLNRMDLSEDMITGYDDVMTAIEEFRSMDRSDYGDAEEYRDARQESFEEILDMVRDFEAVEEEPEDLGEEGGEQVRTYKAPWRDDPRYQEMWKKYRNNPSQIDKDYPGRFPDLVEKVRTSKSWNDQTLNRLYEKAIRDLAGIKIAPFDVEKYRGEGWIDVRQLDRYERDSLEEWLETATTRDVKVKTASRAETEKESWFVQPYFGDRREAISRFNVQTPGPESPSKPPPTVQPQQPVPPVISSPKPEKPERIVRHDKYGSGRVIEERSRGLLLNVLFDKDGITRWVRHEDVKFEPPKPPEPLPTPPIPEPAEASPKSNPYRDMKMVLGQEMPDANDEGDSGISYDLVNEGNVVGGGLLIPKKDALRLEIVSLTPESMWGEEEGKAESIMGKDFIQSVFNNLLEAAATMGKPYVEVRGQHKHNKMYSRVGFQLVDPKKEIWRIKVPTEEVEAPPIVDADSVDDVRALFPTPMDIIDTFPGRFGYLEDLMSRMKAHQDEMRQAEKMHTNTEYDQMIMNNRQKLLDKEYDKAVRMLFADTGKKEPEKKQPEPEKIEEPPPKSPITTSGLKLPEMQQVSPPKQPPKPKLVGRQMQHPRWGVGEVKTVVGKEPSAYVYFDDGRYRWVRTDELEEPWGVVKSSDKIEGGGSMPMDERDILLARIQKMREESETQPEDRKYKTDTQEDVLGKIKFFLEKENEDMKKSLVERFLVGYKQLCMKGEVYRDLDRLFGIAFDVNVMKGFNIQAKGSDDLSMIVYIDAVAHNLHKERIYPILDELASISKSVGEVNRDDRMILLTVPDAKKSLQEIEGIKVIQKGIDLESSPNFWNLLEKAIKNGIRMLTDEEAILLREWMYARI